MIKFNICLITMFSLVLSCSDTTHTLDLDWDPDLRKIVFVSDIEGDANIYLTDIEGNFTKRLTENTGEDSNPVFSPDGEKICYYADSAGHNAIWIMTWDGSDKKKLFDISASYRKPDFTPDGLKVIHLSNDGAILKLINLQTDVVQTLAVNMYTNYALPRAYDFSPDGRQMILSARETNGTYDISVMDLNSNIVEKLNLPVELAKDTGPRYAPDGNKIVFFIEESDSGLLYIFDLITLNLQQFKFENVWNPFGPVFTSDGLNIIFTSDGFLENQSILNKVLGRPSIFIFRIDGSNFKQLNKTNSTTYSRDVIFSSSKDILYYLSDKHFIWKLELSSYKQSLLKDLPFEGLRIQMKESSFFFLTATGGIYRMNVDGTQLVNISEVNNSCRDMIVQP